MIDQLPAKVKLYNRSPVFTQETIPPRLTTGHTTKPDCWVTVTVEEGVLLLYFKDEDGPERLTPDRRGIIVPEVEHYVKPEGDVKFYLEFYQEGRRRHSE